MASIWMVYGTKQSGKPIGALPWPECIELLKLDEYSRTENSPKFGEAETRWPTRVVVLIELDEAREHGIEPGYFASPLTPDNARTRLQRRVEPGS